MEFTRQTKLDDAYNEMHGYKPEVSYKRLNKNVYEIQLVHNGETVILKETMKDGMTDFVTLTHGEDVSSIKSMYEGEVEANKILKG